MANAAIEVRIAGKGSVRSGGAESAHKEASAGTKAVCDLCGADTDAVVSVSAGSPATFACKACLRGRLEAITVASWELRGAEGSGLPWGKVSG